MTSEYDFIGYVDDLFHGTTGRSARNKNPLNLEYRPGTYQDKYGAVLEPTGGGKDKRPRFAQFPDMLSGYLAGIDQILIDQNRGHTLASFVNKFAPPHENPTAQLIAQYSKATGASPDTPLANIPPDKLMIPMMQRESSTVVRDKALLAELNKAMANYSARKRQPAAADADSEYEFVGYAEPPKSTWDQTKEFFTQIPPGVVEGLKGTVQRYAPLVSGTPEDTYEQEYQRWQGILGQPSPPPESWGGQVGRGVGGGLGIIPEFLTLGKIMGPFMPGGLGLLPRVARSTAPFAASSLVDPQQGLADLGHSAALGVGLGAIPPWWGRLARVPATAGLGGGLGYLATGDPEKAAADATVLGILSALHGGVPKPGERPFQIPDVEIPAREPSRLVGPSERLRRLPQEIQTIYPEYEVVGETGRLPGGQQRLLPGQQRLLPGPFPGLPPRDGGGGLPPGGQQGLLPPPLPGLPPPPQAPPPPSPPAIPLPGRILAPTKKVAPGIVVSGPQVETGTYFDNKGNIIKQVSGQLKSVLGDIEASKTAVEFSHTHPEFSPFSKNDVNLFIQSQQKRYSIEFPNGTKWILEKPKGWIYPRELSGYEIKNIVDDIYQKTLLNSDPNASFEQIYKNQSKAIANKFGLNFKEIPLPGRIVSERTLPKVTKPLPTPAPAAKAKETVADKIAQQMGYASKEEYLAANKISREDAIKRNEEIIARGGKPEIGAGEITEETWKRAERVKEAKKALKELKSAPAPAAKEPWEMTRDEFYNANDWFKERTIGYFDEKGERIATNKDIAWKGKNLPVGTWRHDTGQGREMDFGLEQMKEINPKKTKIEFAENVKDSFAFGDKRDYIPKYVEAIKKGMEAPAVEAQELPGGGIRITDGHRRALAHIEAKKPFKAWVTPLNPMYPEAGFVRHADFIEAALKQGKPVPPEVLKDYPDLAQAPAAKEPALPQDTPKTWREIVRQRGYIAAPSEFTQKAGSYLDGKRTIKEVLSAAKNNPEASLQYADKQTEKWMELDPTNYGKKWEKLTKAIEDKLFAPIKSTEKPAPVSEEGPRAELKERKPAYETTDIFSGEKRELMFGRKKDAIEAFNDLPENMKENYEIVKDVPGPKEPPRWKILEKPTAKGPSPDSLRAGLSLDDLKFLGRKIQELGQWTTKQFDKDTRGKLKTEPDSPKNVRMTPKDISIWRRFWDMPEWMPKDVPHFLNPAINAWRMKIYNRLKNPWFKEAAPIFELPKANWGELRELLVGADQISRKGLKQGGEGMRERIDAAINNLKGRYSPETVAAAEAWWRTGSRIWNTLDDVYAKMGMAKSEIDELRREMGYVPYYFPHMRFGKYMVIVRKGNETLHAEGATNRVTRDRRISELKKQFPGAEVKPFESKGVAEEIFFGLNDAHAAQLAKIALRKTGKLTPEVESQLHQALADSLKERGFGRQFIQQKNIPGFETDDFHRVLVNYISGAAGFISKIKAAPEHFKALQNIDAKKDPRLYSYAENYVRFSLRNADRLEELSGKIRGGLFHYFLGWNPKSALLNLTQNITTGAPVLSTIKAKHPGMKLFQAGRDLVKDGRAYWALQHGRDADFKHLQPNEARALKDAFANGWLDDVYTRELLGLVGSRLGKTVSNFEKSSHFLFGNAESYNRATMFLASFRELTKQGKPYNAAIEQANNLTKMSHFAYGKYNLPELAQNPFVRTAYTFRSFSHNYALLLRHLAKNDPAAFGRAIRNLSMLGGIKAVPLVGAAFGIYKALTGQDLWQEAAQDKENNLPYTLARFGVPGAAGIDMSGSVSIEFMRDLESIKDLPKELSGAIGGVGENIADAADFYKRGDYWRMAESLSPQAGRNVLGAYRKATEGVSTRRGQTVLDAFGQPVKLTQGEAIKKALGFQSTRPTIQGEINEYMGDLVKYQQDKADKWASQLINAAKSNDRDNFNEVLQEVADYNRKAVQRGEPPINLDDYIERRSKPRFPVPMKFIPKMRQLQ